MKTISTIIILSLFGAIYTLQAQTNPGETKDGNINLLDAQAQVLGDVFGESLGAEGITGYLDFLEKSDIPSTDKKKLTEYYMMHSKTLDAKSTDSLNAIMIKELQIAIKKDTIK